MVPCSFRHENDDVGDRGSQRRAARRSRRPGGKCVSLPVVRYVAHITVKVMHIGPPYQTGLDLLLATSTFLKMRELYFHEIADCAEFNGKLSHMGSARPSRTRMAGQILDAAVQCLQSARTVVSTAQPISGGQVHSTVLGTVP